MSVDGGRDPGGADATLLSLRDVSVPFGSAPGLAHVTLTLRRGERFALVGTSGAGKSSLLAAVADPGPGVEGAVELEGVDLRTSAEARRRVVLLDQRPLLFPHLDVRRNVAFPLEVRGVRGEALRERVAEVLALVRMEELGSRMPASLSGGQAHRIALARALAAGPRLLLLDEPFTGVDPELRGALQETVVRAAAETGLTTVTVTHDVREAGRIADRIGVLERRRLVRVAPPADLFLDPGSASVAELLGWPNRVPVEVRGGRPLWRGVPLPAPGGEATGEAVGEGSALLVFPRDGGVLVPPGEGHLDVRVERVEPSPDGATARWTAPVDPDRGATASPSGDAAVRGAVAVDALEPPPAGVVRGLRLRPARMRLYQPETSTP